MSYGLLEGKKGIIFGALNNQSIAWKVAERCHEEGAEFILSNAPIGLRMGELNELAEKTGSEIIGADATSVEDLEKLFDAAEEKYGKLDFILHSIGMSVNVRKGRHYTDMNYDWTAKGWDISAGSFHKILQTVWKKDLMNEWASILALSYIAAQRNFPDYNDMADNKAYLESIARSFGVYFGERKVRVNTISQSPTPTTAGTGVKGFGGFISFAEDMSPLGNATADECADFCVAMFSDLTRKITMQNLYHDGGFSAMGVSQKVIDRYTGEN
ncbi:Enoyl-[acyl-carrier-protein] reductase [NADH] [Cruoricaptor ignavus]|uniref:Enoyl-[acyl-carrier-protein] reductase [NADH] n=1 Tax=Cruoricaptor ignavus TaxID=1118202 RepID=A0A1M6C572_9FLAO|nr:SDR family oxidoreductase [Cruoricaptor ignavus]SHI56112.1 Enoyl-[acyl-carrier-protein] reductase [NADH] [Cruoricaptor ignavus]